MTLALLIETTIKGAAVGVCEVSQKSKANLVWHAIHPSNLGASAALVRLVSEAKAALSLGSEHRWESLVVSVGPGSFTGIKVGIAFAQGFCSGIVPNIPLIPVNGLKVLAQVLAQKMDSSKPTVVCLPATANFGFLAFRDEANAQWAMGTIDLASQQEKPVVKWQNDGQPNLAEAEVWVVGEWSIFAKRCNELGWRSLTIEVDKALHASLSGMAVEARAIPKKSVAIDSIKPLYLRLSTPEERAR